MEMKVFKPSIENLQSIKHELEIAHQEYTITFLCVCDKIRALENLQNARRLKKS